MKFRDFLQEATNIVYHGDKFGTNKLEAKFMNNGNNQEGIGIYFGTLDVAQGYGDKIVSTVINKKDFINSRGSIGKEIGMKNLQKLFIALWKTDKEPFYYDLTDWGVEVQEPEDVTSDNILFLANKNSDEEVRNIQVDLAVKFGVEDFVTVWNKILPKVKGTYNKDLEFYAIIDTSTKVENIK